MPLGRGAVAPSGPSTHPTPVDPAWADVNIAVKELVQVTLSAAIWGHTWHKQRIVFKSDNMAVVIALNKRSAKYPRLSHLLRFFLKRTLVLSMKPNISLALTMWGRMHSLAVTSLVSILSSHWRKPARSRKHSPSCSSPPSSAGPHRVGAGTFTLFCGRYRPTTAGTYASAKRRFGEFCQQLGVSPVPAAQHSCTFISHLAQSGLRSTSIQTYMAAIRHMHIKAGFDTPAREHWHQVHYVLRGIRRSHSITPRRTRLPITSDIMRAIQVAVFSPARECSELERHLLWTACCLGFFGFLRSGEFTVKDLRQESSAIDSHVQPSTIRLYIRRPVR